MSWNEYRFFQPSRPKRVENGLKTRNQKGDIGETWWSKRWIAVLESLGMGARLGRGKSYARQGQVISIEISKGMVKARVQGSRSTPYSINISLSPLSDSQWDQVISVMASQAIFAAKLLSGEMPIDIEKAFSAAGVKLFPQSGPDLITSCSCPDFANPCKHIAAVYYILAENLDKDPFLVFTLRGRTKEEILQILRAKRGSAQTPETTETETPTRPAEEVYPEIEDCLDHFWQAGAELISFSTNPAPPLIEDAVLKRLGAPPVELGGEKTTQTLSKAYFLVSQAALRTALGQTSSRPEEDVRTGDSHG